MPTYTYKAKSESGKILSGESKIGSESELISLLVEKGYTPIEVKERNAFTDISTISFLKKKVKIKDLAVFCRQFSIVLEAGVPLAAALDVLREQTLNSTLRECIGDIYECIQKGTSLTNALKQHTGVFPEMMINMVDAGEVSGQLDKVFIRLAENFEKEFKLTHKVKSAMMYPVIVCIISVLVIIVLMAFVVPTFSGVLQGLNVELPIFTKILLAVSGFFKAFWWLVMLALGGLVVAIRTYSKTEGGKRFFGSLAIKIPVLKNVMKNVLTARLTRTLGTLMTSGVLLIQSLEITQKVLGNIIISEKMDTVVEEIKKGKAFAQTLGSIKYFPPMVVSMIRIGEESGNIDFALNKSADFYDQEVETSLGQLTAFIEPIVIILLALVVGFIMLSVLYPMFSIYNTLSQ